MVRWCSFTLSTRPRKNWSVQWEISCQTFGFHYLHFTSEWGKLAVSFFQCRLMSWGVRGVLHNYRPRWGCIFMTRMTTIGLHCQELLEWRLTFSGFWRWEIVVYRDLNMDDLQLKGCPCITKKVSKIMSIISQQIGYSKVGILRSQQHICSKKSGRPWYHATRDSHTARITNVKSNVVLFFPTLTSKIVFLTSLRICRFFSNVASISNKLLTTSGPRTPWKQGRGLFSPSYILAKWICPSHTCRIHTFIENFICTKRN